jgi:hypothetical protein
MEKTLGELLSNGSVKETDIIPVSVNGKLMGHYVIGVDPAVPGGDKTSINNTIIDPSSTPITKIQTSTTYGVMGDNKKSWSELMKTYTGRDVFAIYDNKCISKNVRTDIEHRIYFKNEFKVTPDYYAHLIRGYMMPGQIIFYKTNGYESIKDIPIEILHMVLKRAVEVFAHGEFQICNSNNGKLDLLGVIDI